MSRLPSVRPKQMAAALQKAGFQARRQSGSHLILKHPDGRRVVLAMHASDLKRGTLMAILKDARLTEEELRGLL